ncbi:hypothetical protein ACHAXM_009079 [Skeletonema potamos]
MHQSLEKELPPKWSASLGG